MVAVLVLLSLIALGIGFIYLSQATMGVGILAIACVLAVFARLAQAEAHQKELKILMGAHDNKTETQNLASAQPKNQSKWGGLNDE